MYASNEDEFNVSDSDWVYLRQTPPINTSIHDVVSLAERERSNSSSSSSSNSGSSSKSERSASILSISSIEADSLTSNVHVDERKNHLVIEDPVLINENSDDSNTNNDLLVTDDMSAEVWSSETAIKQDTESETIPVVNEYDLFNGECDLRDESISLSNEFRQPTGVYAQQLVEHSPVADEHEIVPVMIGYAPRRRNKVLVVYGFLLLIFIIQMILARIILSQRLMVNQVIEELDKTNQRLDQMQTISIDEIEAKLTKQFDEKLQNMLRHKKLEYEIEQKLFLKQIEELHQIIYNTKGNFTNIFQQLSVENEQLQKQITDLEHRLQTRDTSNLQIDESCPDGVNCTQISESMFDVLLTTLIKQTTAITENSSMNLSGIFENLSARVLDLVDNRHEYVEQSLQKLADISSSPTAEQVQTTLFRGVEHLTSSFRQAQSTYSAWLLARAEQREKARAMSAEQKQSQKTERHPWRWTFERSHDREQLRHKIPVTKKHVSKKDFVCHAPFTFTVDPLSSMKNWMAKFFRS